MKTSTKGGIFSTVTSLIKTMSYEELCLMEWIL